MAQGTRSSMKKLSSGIIDPWFLQSLFPRLIESGFHH